MTENIIKRIQRFQIAWTEVAPEATFAGMTLADFKSEVAPSFDERASVDSLDALRSAAIARRNVADTTSRKTMLAVVDAVRADSTHGANGALYRALGYTPKNERRSGLTRKGKLAATTQSPMEQAA